MWCQLSAEHINKDAHVNTHTHSILLPVTGASKSIAASEQRLSKWNPKTMCSLHSSINHTDLGTGRAEPGIHQSSLRCSHTAAPCCLVTASPVLPGENPVRAVEVYPASRVRAQWAGDFVDHSVKPSSCNGFSNFPRSHAGHDVNKREEEEKKHTSLQKPIN